MGVSAHFSADFSQFNRAVDMAIVTLKKFDTNILKVEDDLNGMVDQFNGRKLIQEATLAAEAVDRIGGTSRLTQAELQRVGMQAQEATEKLRAMGQDVPQKLQHLADAVEKPNAAMRIWDGTMKQVAGTIAASFTAGAIAAAIRSTGEWAGNINDLSAKFKISTDAVQRFDFAARQNGTTIDDVGTAMTRLSKSLVEGDGAVPALKRLGLELDYIKGLGVDEAFKEVGRAVAAMENPMEQVAVSTQLMGRGAADLIPMFQNLDKDMGRAVVASDSMIKAGDSLGDSWDSILGTGKALMAGVLAPMAPALDAAASAAANFAREQIRIAEATNRVNDELKKQGAFLPSSQSGFKGAPSPVAQQIQREIEAIQRAEMLAQSAGGRGLAGRGFGAGSGFEAVSPEAAEQRMKRVEDQLKSTTKEHDAAAKAADRNAEAVKKLNQEYQAWLTKTQNAKGEELFKQAAASFSGIQDAVEAGLMQIQGLVPNFAKVGSAAGKAALDVTKFNNALFALPAKLGGSQGVSGEVDPIKGIFGSFLGGAGKGLSGLLEGITGGKGIGGLFGNLGGGIVEGFGNIISGGLSGLISSGVGLAAKGLGKLFGGIFGGGEGVKVNDMRDQIVSAAGGIDELARKAAAAGANLDAFLSAKKVKDFEAAWRDLSKTMDAFTTQQIADQERLAEALQKYKFTLEEMGPALQRQRLDDQARDLIEDWRVLVGAGVDVNVVNDKMADSINEYLQAAIKTGTEVPAAMKPILERMIQSGELTDEAGKAFESLNATGLTFSATLSDVVAKLDELIKKLIEAGDTSFGLPNISVPNWEPPPPGGDTFSAARGTGGRYLDFGGGTKAVLHGRERVITANEGRAEQEAVVSAVNQLGRQMSDLLESMPVLMMNAALTRT